MDLLRHVVSGVSSALDFNKATLSGALDVIAVRVRSDAPGAPTPLRAASLALTMRLLSSRCACSRACSRCTVRASRSGSAGFSK